MVWPTLGSRTAKEQNRTEDVDIFGLMDTTFHARGTTQVDIETLNDCVNGL